MIPKAIDRLRHTRDAANAAIEFTAGKDRAVLASDRIFQFAIVRAVEIIGEDDRNVRLSAMELACRHRRWSTGRPGVGRGGRRGLLSYPVERLLILT
jgi:hypothetical protein